MFWVDIASFSLVKNLYFYLVTPTFVLHTLMCLKSIGRPFTVENLPWKKRDILLGPCLDQPRSQGLFLNWGGEKRPWHRLVNSDL